MAGVEGEVAGGPEAPEASARAEGDRKRVVAEVRLGIEQHVALADGGEGIAFLRQDHGDVRLRPLDALGNDRLTGLQRQVLGDEVGRGSRLRLNRDAADPVALAGRDLQYGGDRLAVGGGRAVDARLDRGVVPSLRLQQALDELAVLG